MKVTVRLPTDIEFVRVRCVLPYDGEDYEEQSPADFPGRDGTEEKGTITLEIDLDAGRVIGWPKGRHGSLYLKVCNSGQYTLIGANDESFETWEEYVPGWLPGESTGDYFIADIQGDGAIYHDGERWEADADEISIWLNGLLDKDAE
jgi:hypothetical protein